MFEDVIMRPKVAARELGFPYGGMIPKGRLAEDGIVPSIKIGVK